MKGETTFPPVELSEIGMMLRTISLDYPELTMPKEISEKISSEFGVNCKVADIQGYYKLHVEYEELQAS